MGELPSLEFGCIAFELLRLLGFQPSLLVESRVRSPSLMERVISNRIVALMVIFWK